VWVSSSRASPSMSSTSRPSSEMPLKMVTIVSPKRRDNSPTPGGDILEDVVDSFTRRSLRTYLMKKNITRWFQKLSYLIIHKIVKSGIIIIISISINPYYNYISRFRGGSDDSTLGWWNLGS
jgi:hypothetical protein